MKAAHPGEPIIIALLTIVCALSHKGVNHSMTPLAKDELSGPRGAGYRRMIENCAVGRAGTPDEVGNVGALLMGADGAFITGSDFLMDGGVTAAYWFGELAVTH